MHLPRFLLLVATLVTLSPGCQKDRFEPSCQRLKEGMRTDNKDMAGEAVTAFIRRLSSQAYSEQNLNLLADMLSRQCSITANVLCFDCIMTYPSQSELLLSFDHAGTTISKVIDLSFTPDKKLRFSGMHN